MKHLVCLSRTRCILLVFNLYGLGAQAQAHKWQERVAYNTARATVVCTHLFEVASQSHLIKAFYESQNRVEFLARTDLQAKALLLEHLSLNLVQMRSSKSRRAFALSQSMMELLGADSMSPGNHFHFALQWIPRIIESYPQEAWQSEAESKAIRSAFHDLITVSGLNERFNRKYPGLTSVWPETLDAIGDVLKTPALYSGSPAALAIAKETLPLLPMTVRMAVGDFSSIPAEDRLFELRFAALRLMPALVRIVVKSPATTKQDRRIAHESVMRVHDCNFGHSFKDFEELAIQATQEMGYRVDGTP